MGRVQRVAAATLLVATCLAGCGSEQRPGEEHRPRTPPTGAGDERIGHYLGNRFQVARGARYFAWYGCGSCHSDADPDEVLDLADGRWRHGGGFHDVYASIVSRHPPGVHARASRIPVEPLWQMTAYVLDLEQTSPAMRRRQELDRRQEARAPLP